MTTIFLQYVGYVCKLSNIILIGRDGDIISIFASRVRMNLFPELFFSLFFFEINSNT